MSEHTKGPWTQAGRYVYAEGPDGANICAMSEPRASTFVGYTRLEVGSKDLNEAFANARLIAHAPDMLEELRQCQSEIEEASKLLAKHYPQVASLYETAAMRVAAVIAEATGAA